MKRRMRVVSFVLCAVMGQAMAGAADRLPEPVKGARVVADKPYARFCEPRDLVGTWRLVKFDSQYEFKDPKAPSLLPHQLFQFSADGGMRSAHSATAFDGDPTQVFQNVPPLITYGFERKGMVTVKAKAVGTASETWHCVTITESRNDEKHHVFMKRGDLVMTLVGKQGQRLFIRQLRKGGS
ncbi:MAG: hypothetical protein ACT4OO_07685 [Nitrospiraceae bacterium]